MTAEFQFQLGAIKGRIQHGLRNGHVEFQFQLGAIKGVQEVFHILVEKDFNSN